MKFKLEIPKGRIKVIPIAEGESIEQKMFRVSNSKEPIDNIAPLIYTEKKDGVLPQYDHRTDRFEQARIATDRVHSTRAAMAKKAAEAAIQEIKEGKTPQGEA